MRPPTRSTGLLAGFLLAGSAALALPAPPQERGDALRGKLNDLEPRGGWIYDDLDRGLAEARKSGRPLMAVFR